MKASYVLPCYIPDEEIMALTRAAIDSFRKVDAQLVIADDASPIGGGYLREQADIYIRSQYNEGYYETITRALKLASGDILAICNNDIRVSNSWLTVAKNIFKNPKIASVHFKMIPYDEEMVLGDRVWETGKERWCTTSFATVRKSVYEQMGFYDPFYKRGGFGDWDLWFRVREAGYLTAYTNRACYQHRDSAITSRMHNKDWSKHEKENLDYFKEKWGMNPDDLLASKYPEQMDIPWRRGFE